MARLETQINQIYLTHSEHKKNSLILYEEQLTSSLQLFVVAELWNIQKKSENTDLKKISEIILQSFRNNKKLSAEMLFETSLSTINQNLADLAHEGRKSWVGKFSCLICIKGLDNNIYLANNGQTSAWLLRKSELMEILPAEKRGTHPLKTFINFTQGKLADNDSLILTTSNIFNYISFELFSKLLERLPLDQASEEIRKILQDSVSADIAFSSFMMHFTKKPLEELPITATPNDTDIYAPIMEEESNTVLARPKFKIPKLPSIHISLPKFNFEWLKKIQLPYFQNLSLAGKFFFISFAIFLLLFLINLGIYAVKLQGKKTQNRVDQLVEKINNDIAQTQSALIYKNENEAVKQLDQTIADLEELTKLDPAAASEVSPKVEQVKTVVNKINTVLEPKTFVDLKRHPTFISNVDAGFLFANEDSNSLSLFSNSTLTDYFLLNSVKNKITSIAYFQPAGVVVATADEIYRIDQSLKQFEPIVDLTNQNIRRIRVANSAIYTLGNEKISKITYRARYQTQVSISGNFTDARDFGVDKDFYVLYADKIIKFVSGQAQAFPLPNMSEDMTNASKIFVGANIYILENNKKRIIVLNKNGALVNQIYFPSATTLLDFYVDESSRSLYLLDDNKLYKVTI